MSEADLYRAGVSFAGFGGIVLGLFGAAFQLSLRRLDEPTEGEWIAFSDARIISCISLVPQGCLLALPLLYPSRHDVPKSLGPAAIFVAAMLLCVYIWLLTKLFSCGRLRRWFSLLNLFFFSAPAILTLLAVAVFIALGRR